MTAVYLPSPHDRAREQAARYEATSGREGGTLDGRPVVILTTTGARTGHIRKNPIMRIKDGDTYVAVASNGGATTNPSWYHNLIAHPEVWLQDGEMIHRFRAREVRGEEKARWWVVADRAWSHFAAFRAEAGDREIPVIVLEPMTPRDHNAKSASTVS
ncbi:nitroreductase family deazaflavin-dependent oxidoreductase [Nocardia sp. NPDC050630]|uniref:nitroreductase family deazaflavin-dependent oxidoreductase n=1 Tax=Nocardia sp. NPDC050630 TaxID=3364321 RepID=UPI0037B747F7